MIIALLETEGTQCSCSYVTGLGARNSAFDVSEQQMRRPACAFAQSGQRFCYLLSGGIIAKLSICKSLISYLVSVAKQAGLNVTWLRASKSDFLARRPKNFKIVHPIHLRAYSK